MSELPPIFDPRHESQAIQIAPDVPTIISNFVRSRDQKGQLQALIGQCTTIAERRAIFDQSLTAVLHAKDTNLIGQQIFNERILAILEADGTLDELGNRDFQGVIDVIVRWHEYGDAEHVDRANRLCETISFHTMTDRLGYFDRTWCNTERLATYIKDATTSIVGGRRKQLQTVTDESITILEELMHTVIERVEDGEDELAIELFEYLKQGDDADEIFQTMEEYGGRATMDFFESNYVDLDNPPWATSEYYE